MLSWPHQVGVIPPRARSFQQRVEVERVRDAVADPGTAVLCQVLSGAGGVGKTQLAADYARSALRSDSVDLLVWITAGTRAAAVSGYAQAAVEVLGADPADREQAMRAFLAWLEPKPGARPCRWLVILDDVADPADLRGLWPPTSPHGRTLATTRRRDAALTGTGRRLVPVGLFTEAEAAAYLTTSLAAHGRHESPKELSSLACALGRLPLALSQAAAYIIDADLDCATYRQLLTDRTSSLEDLMPEPPSLPDDQSTGVAAAWSLSIDRANQLRPAGLARPVLQLAAMLDANGIPTAVLTSPPALAHLNPTAQERDALGALRALHRLSLINHSPDTPHQAVRVHQLIQRAVREPLHADEYDQIARTAADALTAAWPEVERDTALAQTLRANTETLTSHAEDALWRPGAHPVLFRIGRSLGESGQTTAAMTHYQHLATAARERLGLDHPDTLTVRHDLAWWQGWAGDAAGAAGALAELLTDQERALGSDHPQTLITRGDLAWWRGVAGDTTGTVTALINVVEDRVRVLGPDHSGTLFDRGRLAWRRGETGDATGAADALAELLSDQMRVLGPDHPHTLSTRNNLAYWRGETGDATGAADALAELLSDQMRVLGPDHPHTLNTRNNLAYWRGKAGDATGAADALAELLADKERVLGPDHPQTLDTRNNLAYWRGEMGDAAG